MRLDVAPAPHPDNVVRGDNYRITLITDGIMRIQWSDTGEFDDVATQTVLRRNLGPVDYQIVDEDAALRITTSRFQLHYDKKPFTPRGLVAHVLDVPSHHATWRYGETPAPRAPEMWRSFGGTVRTLDDVDGATDLGHGLASFLGFTVIDDSDSLALADDGMPTPRAPGVDLYLVAYGHDIDRAVKDFYRLTGPQPRLPRWSLGNWWSRYHDYTSESYTSLMDKFAAENVPLSVAVLDMDWHVTDIPASEGRGWTGFTWNRSLFPHPKDFLSDLKRRGLHVSANLHPADGIRRHEDAYPAIAEAMGIDPKSGTAVAFDPSSAPFWQAYFEHVIKPLEDGGIDFWWVDWQQGAHSAIPGLDPLWALNHFHYLDSAKDGKRGLTLSRYAGLGSHRYPVGFSGDTVTSWESLAFQPKFTSAASNVGYGWWSHDIGGHLGGVIDGELYARWVQLGCFSPILRLHSTADPAHRREPWEFAGEPGQAAADALRFRHKLIPYIYTMAERAHSDGTPLVRPLYWTHLNAYMRYAPTFSDVENQFWFGQDVLVIPITRRSTPGTGLASAHGYLPPGEWVDIYTGLRYDGDRIATFTRTTSEYVALARIGTIVPLAKNPHGHGNPAELEILVVAGGDGSFTLYEDDDSANPHSVVTAFDWSWEERSLQISPVMTDRPLSSDHDAVVPPRRAYSLRVVGVRPPTDVEIAAGARFDSASSTIEVSLGDVSTTKGATFRLPFDLDIATTGGTDRVARILASTERTVRQERLLLAVRDAETKMHQMRLLREARLPDPVEDALVEHYASYDITRATLDAG